MNIKEALNLPFSLEDKGTDISLRPCEKLWLKASFFSSRAVRISLPTIYY